MSYVTDSICSVIPGAGTLLAPMGLGVELSFDCPEAQLTSTSTHCLCAPCVCAQHVELSFPSL